MHHVAGRGGAAHCAVVPGEVQGEDLAPLDPEAVGLEISTFIPVSLENQVGHTPRRFEEAIEGWPEIMECQLMTGDSDQLLQAVAPALKAL